MKRTVVNAFRTTLSTLSIVVVLVVATGAQAEKRVALIIGNSNYSKAGMSDLANTKNDARDIAIVLKQKGFSLIGGGVQIDLTRQDMLERILDFGDQLGPDTIGLFFYAGHGLAVNKTNFLVPIDGKANSKREVPFRMVSADSVMEQFRETGGGLNIMILDACRNTPASYRGIRAGGGEGLTEMQAASGTLISYSTQPGNVAMDGQGRNSPYAVALMDAMKTPGLGILKAFNQVSLTVKKRTNSFQVPWNTSVALEGDFFFSGQGNTAKPTVPSMTPDMLAWQSIQSTTNPAEIEQFVIAFSASPFVGMAKARLEKLNQHAPAKTMQQASLQPQQQSEAKPKSTNPLHQMSQNLFAVALDETGLVKNIDVRIKTLLALAETQFVVGNMNNSNRAFQEALRIAVARPDKDKRKSNLYVIVQTAAKVGAYALAEQAADHIPNTDSYFEYTIRIISEAHLKDGNQDEAERTLQKIQDESKRISTQNQLVVARAKDGDFISALRLVNSMDEESRRYALGMIAKYQAKAGDLEGAFISLGGIKEPFRPFYMDGVADAQVNAGDTKGAHQTMRRAVALQNKYNDDVWNGANNLAGLAKDQARLGDIDGARKTINQALAASSSDWPRQNTAIAQAMAGDIDAALSTLRGITEDDSRDTGYRGVAPAQAKTGDFEGAVDTAGKITEAGKRASTYATLVSVIAEAGNSTYALKVAKNNITDTAKRSSAIYSVVEALIKSDDLVGALATAKEIPVGNNYRRSALDGIVKAYVKRGAFDQALAAGAALSAGNSNETTFYYVVEGQVKSNNIQDALQTFKRFPKNSRLRVSAGALIAEADVKTGPARSIDNISQIFTTQNMQDIYLKFQAETAAKSGDFPKSLRLANGIQKPNTRANAINGVIKQMFKKQANR